MALQKANVAINFSKGLDLKTDPLQVAVGNFLSLQNSVFDVGGLLKKRNGFKQLTPLPNTNSEFISKLGGNLTAIGSRLSSYSAGSMTWVDKGPLQPADVSVLSVVRGNVGQSQADSVTHPNGITCTVFTDDLPTGGGVLTSSYKYTITDSTTGQGVVSPVVIPVTTGTITHPPKVFLVNNYFVIVFINSVSGNPVLQYVAINAFTPTVASTNATISSNIIPGTDGLAPYFEGVVANNTLYLAWNATGGDIRMNFLTSTLALGSPKVITGYSSTCLSVTADTTGVSPVIYTTSYDSATGDTTVFVVDQNLTTVTAPTTLLSSVLVSNLASAAKDGSLLVFYEQPNTYGYNLNISTNLIRSVSMTQSGTVSVPSLVTRSLGLASKAMIIDSSIYVLGTYVSEYQPTYFLINERGQVIVKLAYSNGSGSYFTKGLPSATVTDTSAKLSYLIKSRIEAVNKAQGASSTSGVYSQTGVNTATITITSEGVSSAEIGRDLHVTGGFMWMYDGNTPVEHGFHLWPDYVEASSGGNGGMRAQKHYYVATYEWTDAQGNVFRSAPSLPILVDTTDSVGVGVTFTAVFTIGDTTFNVSSTEGLYVGMPIADISNSAAFPVGTKITNVGVGAITVDNAAVANSASSPGDNMATTTVAAEATYTAGASSIQVDSTTGFQIGQRISDIVTPANFDASTTITSIDSTTGTLGISSPTLGASSSDQIQTSAITAYAYFEAGSTTLRVSDVSGFGVGSSLVDVTVGGAFQPNTKIVAVDPVNFVITIDKPTVSGTGTPVQYSPAAETPLPGILPTFSVSCQSGIPEAAGGTAYFPVNFPLNNPTVGQLALFIPSIPSIPYVNPITYFQNIMGSIYMRGSKPLPNGNTNIYSATPVSFVTGHVIQQAAVVLSATFPSGSVILNVSSTTNLGLGMTISDLTTPGNIAGGTTITAINATANTIQISTPTLGGTTPSVVQSADVFSATINVPTLRTTYKIDNPVRIALYRWSVAQQTYYQVTPVLDPTLNDTSADYVVYTDRASDPAILGNNILYTTGGVIENIAAPAVSALTLYRSRLFAVDAEDRNLLWYSKQVIESTPVEMSDLFTVYVAPTTAAQGDTGPITALAALDDKLIIFKKNAIYYLTGNGPDNTGNNNDFSEPVFISSAVGCDNPRSIVFTPTGLLFQSDKGIWMLGRDLSTAYVGAAVETEVLPARAISAVNIPGTNQVRFMMDSGITLMYDYYYQQWGTFTNIPAVSSVIYQDLHTFINARGEVYQETPGLYLDGGHPVLLGFTTSWLNLAGLQGFERAYFFYLLGTFLTPHKLSIGIAYDYNPSITQQSIITPDNYAKPYGGEQLWGSNGGWGGNGNIEQHRVFLQQQKCQAFQITLNEIFDPSEGTVAGAGLTLSGLNAVIGLKSAYPRLKASKSVG